MLQQISCLLNGFNISFRMFNLLKRSVISCWSLLLLLLPTLVKAAPEPSQPNIIVILADDLGYGDISCNGAQSLETPQIDRLARKGFDSRADTAPRRRAPQHATHS